MITKHDLGLYSELFQKANKLLENNDKATHIDSIDSYFSNLGHIKDELYTQNLNDISYFMLPLDEPLFEINANTRTIKIPEAFKNGIGVQGDEVAEVIFFSIDRYFDATDFYNDNIIPVIQWKSANESTYHLSAATGKIIMVDEKSETGGTVKVVFGWPISQEVTTNAGNIQFSVRFYTIVNQDTGELITSWEQFNEGILEYSFSTLNAVTKINPCLNVEIINGNYSYDDKNYLIWKRMRNSSIVNLDLKAINPIIEKAYYWPEAGTFADLDEDGYVVLKVRPTYPSGTAHTRIGEQIYEIWRIGVDDKEELYARGSAKFNEDIDDGEGIGFESDYMKVPDSETKRNSNDEYFKQIIEEDGSVHYQLYKDDSNDLIKGLYKKVQTYKIDKAGKYYVNIINFINEDNKGNNSTKPFEIALPSRPIVGQSSSDKYSGYIIEKSINENGIEVITPVILTLSTEDTDGKTPLVYNWYRKENDSGIDPDKDIPLNESPSDSATFIIDEDDEKFGPGYYYYLEAINWRNNESISTFSKGIRVTYPATTPNKVNYLINGYLVDQAQLLESKELRYTTELSIKPESDRCDSFRYEWYKEGSSAILNTSSKMEFTQMDIGNVIYCKIFSIYNTNESEPYETAHFTIV